MFPAKQFFALDINEKIAGETPCQPFILADVIVGPTSREEYHEKIITDYCF